MKTNALDKLLSDKLSRLWSIELYARIAIANRPAFRFWSNADAHRHCADVLAQHRTIELARKMEL